MGSIFTKEEGDFLLEKFETDCNEKKNYQLMEVE
jgi:hypothetical protein